MSSRAIRTIKRKFGKELDNLLNIDFDVDLPEWKYEIQDNDIDLDKVAGDLMKVRERHKQAVSEYKQVLDNANPKWAMYNSLKSLYEVAYINMKFVELAILNELFDKHIAALCAKSEEDFYYPASVLWKTRSTIIDSCQLQDAEEFFSHYLFKQPTHDQSWDEHGTSIDLNIRIILTSERLMHRISYKDMPKIKSLLDMSIEALEGMTCKYNAYEREMYVSTQ